MSAYLKLRNRISLQLRGRGGCLRPGSSKWSLKLSNMLYRWQSLPVWREGPRLSQVLWSYALRLRFAFADFFVVSRDSFFARPPLLALEFCCVEPFRGLPAGTRSKFSTSLRRRNLRAPIRTVLKRPRFTKRCID